MINIIIVIISTLLILAGLVGIILPAIPGVPLVFAGVFIYTILTKFISISWITIIFLAILTILSLIIDYASGLIGAKKLGATKYGIWGGLVGLLIGLIFSPFGLISVVLMPLIGTIAGELIAGKKILHASKIGLGTLIGYLFAISLDLIIAGITIFTFIRAVF